MRLWRHSLTQRYVSYLREVSNGVLYVRETDMRNINDLDLIFDPNEFTYEQLSEHVCSACGELEADCVCTEKEGE